MAEGGDSQKQLESRSLTPPSLSFADHKRGVYTNIQNAVNVQLNGQMTVYMDSSCHIKKRIKTKKPLTNSTEPVTRDQVLNIKDRLGRDWKDLGRRLQFEDSVLEQMHLEHKDEMAELNYQILSGWMRREPQNATQAKLAQIFKSMSRGDLADLLAE